MKIFEIVRRQYATLGISSSSFDIRMLCGFLVFGYVIVSHFLYIIYVTSGFMEYVNSINSTSATIVTSTGFAAIVFRRATLFESIDSIEKLIDASKCILSCMLILHEKIGVNSFGLIVSSGCKYPQSRRIFLRTHQQIERSSEVVYTWVVKIAFQCVMLPTCFASVCGYFIDLGNTQFELPIPMW